MPFAPRSSAPPRRTGLRTLLQSGAALLAVSSLAGCVVPPETAPAPSGTLLIGTLLPQGEVPGPGDPDGTGEFTGYFDANFNKLCYTIGTASLDTITMIHVHKGEPGVSGPPVITLTTPTDAIGHSCVDTASGLIAEILANPAGYYVNVHTSGFPAGAIRSQLMRPN